MKKMKSANKGVSKAVLLVLAGVIALSLSGCEDGVMSAPSESFVPTPVTSHTGEFYDQPLP